MTSYLRPAMASLFSVTTLLAACSGGGSGSIGGGSLTTSVPGNKTLTSLSPAERSQLCADLTRFYNAQINEADRKKATCASEAFSKAFSATEVGARVEQCKTAYQECLAKPSTSQPRTLDDGECSTSKIFETCSATVSEVSTCMQELASAQRASYSQYDAYCDRFQADGGITSIKGSSSQMPQSCRTYVAKCPGLVENDQ